MTVAFAFIFSFVGGFVTERFGRRPAILVASVVFTIGSVVMAVSPTKAVLLVGRIVVGMGIGMASMCIPVYMAETSPVELRGFLGASFQVMICFGQVVAAVVDALFGEVKDGWKYDFGLAGIPSIILLVGFFFCPESPRWLVQVGREEEAKKALERLRNKGDAVDQELREIKEMVAEDKKIQAMTEGGGAFSRAWKDPNVRKALLVGCSLQLFQQLIGINTVIYYSARILMMSGISKDMTMILWLSALVSAINFFASFLGMALIDRLGRRILALGSYTGILLSLIVIGLGFQLSENNTTAADTVTMEPGFPGDQAIYSKCASFDDCMPVLMSTTTINVAFATRKTIQLTARERAAVCLGRGLPPPRSPKLFLAGATPTMAPWSLMFCSLPSIAKHAFLPLFWWG
jgi:SP family myo-inositol transporter-like MFS transporter 13